MRQSREELIKRGVLKEIYDKGKGTGPLSMGQKAVRGICVYIFSDFNTGFLHYFIRICTFKTADNSGEKRECSRQR